MNKYELALVVSAKIEDDARTATVEKAKEYITRAGGTVTEVEDWGCLLYTSPSPRDRQKARMPSSA